MGNLGFQERWEGGYLRLFGLAALAVRVKSSSPFGDEVSPVKSRFDPGFLTGTGTQVLNVRCIGRLVAGPRGAADSGAMASTVRA